jgi:uncharacterized protein YndB with AHSA1/START domain
VPRPFSLDRTWRFDETPEQLWSLLERTGDYPTWFSWLAAFESEGLAPQAATRLTVRPPLPYRLDVEVTVEEVRPASLVVVSVDGDLAGPGRLELSPRPAGPGGPGTDARLVWDLDLRRPMLVSLERVARPAMAWGHDRVVDLGVRGFRRRALGASAPPP